MENGRVTDATSRYVRPEGDDGNPAEGIPRAGRETTPSDIEQRLSVLKDLLDKHLIFREDCEQKKAEILRDL